MTKPKPLKGKQFATGMGEPHHMVYFHKDKDIKSAAEWLKKYIIMWKYKPMSEWDATLKKLYYDFDHHCHFEQFLINRAFEDVMKNETNDD